MLKGRRRDLKETSPYAIIVPQISPSPGISLTSIMGFGFLVLSEVPQQSLDLLNLWINDLAENILGTLSGCCDEQKLRGIAHLLDIRTRVQKDVNRQT